MEEQQHQFDNVSDIPRKLDNYHHTFVDGKIEHNSALYHHDKCMQEKLEELTKNMGNKYTIVKGRFDKKIISSIPFCIEIESNMADGYIYQISPFNVMEGDSGYGFYERTRMDPDGECYLLNLETIKTVLYPSKTCIGKYKKGILERSFKNPHNAEIFSNDELLRISSVHYNMRTGLLSRSMMCNAQGISLREYRLKFKSHLDNILENCKELIESIDDRSLVSMRCDYERFNNYEMNLPLHEAFRDIDEFKDLLNEYCLSIESFLCEEPSFISITNTYFLKTQQQKYTTKK